MVDMLLADDHEATFFLRELEPDPTTHHIPQEEWTSIFTALTTIGQSPTEALQCLTEKLTSFPAPTQHHVRVTVIEGVDLPTAPDRTPKIVISHNNNQKTLEYHKPSRNPFFSNTQLTFSNVAAPDLLFTLYLSDRETPLADTLAGVASLPLASGCGTTTLYFTSPSSSDGVPAGSLVIGWEIRTDDEAVFTPRRDHSRDPNDLSQISPPML
eukprot:TRINITY_DN8447_c0_g1_i1.p1 TRINITY_DN8447_c0_g1~~TRINITY_DN8447_c0_g1_i1.p1  ORF type:complete len:236 (+),score=57.01 TRINITY_DN8447_c0_g1_i1:74-709(+)